MAERWYVIQVKRDKEPKAMVEIVRRGFDAFCPMMQKSRKNGRSVETVTVPRFPPYLFARFNASVDPWGLLCHDDGKRAGIVRVLCNAYGIPIAVPDRAMDAMRAYNPPPSDVVTSITFQTGQPVTVYRGGVAMQAVFVKYEGKRRAKIKVWLFGEATETEIDPRELHPQHERLTKSAS